MKPLIFILLCICSYKTYSQPAFAEIPNIDPQLVQKNFRTWWDYHNRNIRLAENFSALDNSSNMISKEIFLNLLSSGKFIAIKMEGSELTYKLYPINLSSDKDIATQAKRLGEDGYIKYKMEGTEIPDFNFRDVNGKLFSKESLKGKIVVLKCWFVHCTTCVQEMPALNELVKEYKKRKEVVFISFAYDSKERLDSFLLTKKFDYAVIPVPEKFIVDSLKVTAYPTQFIINKEGIITKVVNDYHDMISSLNNELSK